MEDERNIIYSYLSKDANFWAELEYPESTEVVVDGELTMHQVAPSKWWNELFTGTMEELDAYVRTKDIELNNE